MPSMNRVTLLGHLGKDPQIRSLGSGSRVANFSLATSNKWTDKTGNKREETEWHNIVVYGDISCDILEGASKGDVVWVEGELRSRSYETKEGDKRFVTEVVVQFPRGQFVVQGRRAPRAPGEATYSETDRFREQTSFVDENEEDEIPF